MTWLSLLLGAIGVLAFIVGAIAYLKNAIDKATIDTLTKNAAALAERVKVLEATDARQTAQIEDLTRQNGMLLSQRPSAEAIALLAQALDDHDKRTMKILEAAS